MRRSCFCFTVFSVFIFYGQSVQSQTRADIRFDDGIGVEVFDDGNACALECGGSVVNFVADAVVVCGNTHIAGIEADGNAREEIVECFAIGVDGGKTRVTLYINARLVVGGKCGSGKGKHG